MVDSDSIADPPTESIVLYDGVCALCSRTVRFITARDRRRRFRFEPLESETGRALLARHGLGSDDATVVLIEAGTAYVRSSAILRIARRLRAPWPCCGVFLLVPACLRDAVYDFVAKRRHRWFGRTVDS